MTQFNRTGPNSYNPSIFLSFSLTFLLYYLFATGFSNQTEEQTIFDNRLDIEQVAWSKNGSK
jgi:hypothetical protein